MDLEYIDNSENIIIKGMTPQEFKNKMQELKDKFGSDFEAVHGCMDDLMLECLRSLGYQEGCDIFDSQEMWYA